MVETASKAQARGRPLRQLRAKILEGSTVTWSWFWIRFWYLGVGTSLVRGPYCQLGVSLCDAYELKKVLGWAQNRTSKEAPDSTC